MSAEFDDGGERDEFGLEPPKDGEPAPQAESALQGKGPNGEILWGEASAYDEPRLSKAPDPDAAAAEPAGTYACPICGFGKPHTHSPSQVADAGNHNAAQRMGMRKLAEYQSRTIELKAEFDRGPAAYAAKYGSMNTREGARLVEWLLERIAKPPQPQPDPNDRCAREGCHYDRAHHDSRFGHAFVEPAPQAEAFVVKLTCCGRENGQIGPLPYAECDKQRNSYLSGVGVGPGGHQRSAIIEACDPCWKTADAQPDPDAAVRALIDVMNRANELTGELGALDKAVAGALSDLDQWRIHHKHCRHCGSVLTPTNQVIADGCPCNSGRGINHGLVAVAVCTCAACDPAQTGSSRFTADAIARRGKEGA